MEAAGAGIVARLAAIKRATAHRPDLLENRFDEYMSVHGS
jgi:hypothetical protein